MLGGCRAGCAVLIEPDQVQTGVMLQQQATVTATTEGGVEQETLLPAWIGVLLQRLQQHVGQHGNVAEGVGGR